MVGQEFLQTKGEICQVIKYQTSKLAELLINIYIAMLLETLQRRQK